VPANDRRPMVAAGKAAMSQPAKTEKIEKAEKAEEPTMEEILASIRRIIADDDSAKGSSGPVTHFAAPSSAAPAAVAPPAPAGGRAGAAAGDQDDVQVDLDRLDSTAKTVPPPASDVLELTESMRSKGPAFETIEGPPDVVFCEAAEPDEPPRPAPPSPPQDMLRTRSGSAAPERTLLSPRTTAAVDMAFNSLAHTVLVQNARTLEDLVREMLKPMLKTWLDDNLPNMVERLVRAEIERVSRGRG
jgi:uncharacterized protein